MRADAPRVLENTAPTPCIAFPALRRSGLSAVPLFLDPEVLVQRGEADLAAAQLTHHGDQIGQRAQAVTWV
ncbi:hypothetical protein ACWCSH_08460 [Streptosporangium sp. NPDC001682]